MPIELQDVSYVYDQGFPSAKTALSHISLTLREDEFTGLIGHTGSGKSTLVTLLNGLSVPTEGKVLYNGEDIHEFPAVRSKRKARRIKAEKYRRIRQQVGLVFQYPEQQLFETTVAEDIAFGPKNLGLSEEEIQRRVHESMQKVGLDDSYREKSPFELSGGQKRRVAIAGVLAMEPKYLILDEPTAGLDPKGRDEILGEVRALKENSGITVILVSHSMDDVAQYCERIIAMNDGKIVLDGTPAEVFSHEQELKKIGLGVPQMTELSGRLKEKGFTFSSTILTVEQMKEALLPQLSEKPALNAPMQPQRQQGTQTGKAPEEGDGGGRDAS